ncbi:hypothetical protein LINPERPRIM_LOCUS28868 [Linum perenne]
MYPHYEYFNPAMQQQYPPHSMPTPPADTRPDDMVESDGMSNDESRKKWTIEDDKLLASSYLIISTDSVKGVTGKSYVGIAPIESLSWFRRVLRRKLPESPIWGLEAPQKLNTSTVCILVL